MPDTPTYDKLIQEVSTLLQTPDSAKDFLADLIGVLQAHVVDSDLDQATFNSFLRKLHHVYVKLDQLQTLDELYVQLVALGISDLGYDHLHLLLLLEDGQFASYYSSAQDGSVVEVDPYFAMTPECQQRLNTLVASGCDVQLWQDIKLYHQGQLAGQGWQVIALMNDGRQIIGGLAADNLYRQHPVRPFEEDLLTLYSGALGNMISRKRASQQWQVAQKTADEFQQYLKNLHEISIALAVEEQSEDLHRRIIELGRERLGYERLGLFVINPKSNALESSWGIDTQGKLRYEGDSQPGLAAKQHFLKSVQQSKDRVLLREDIDLWDEDQVVGRGWHIIAALWDGTEVMGYLVTDNLTTQSPLRPYERELFTLYSSTIGHLLSNKRKEKALRDSETRFRMLVEIAPVGVIVVTQEGRVVSANKHALMMFGYSRAESNDLWLDNLLPSPVRSKHQQYVDHYFDDPGEQPIYMAMHMEPLGLRRDGSTFPVQVALSTFELDDELLTLAAVADLSEQKEAEFQRFALQLEKERTAILTDFIKDAAHEFRTPLSIVKSSTYLLERISDETRREVLYERIRDESDHIVKLVEALSTLARLDRNSDIEFRQCNLSGIVHAVVDSMESAFEAQQLSLSLDIPDGPVMIEGSAEDLNLTLSCLLDNAIRYSEPEGEVSLKMATNGDHVTIKVQDEGVGIPDEIKAHIFTRFYRADYAHSTRGFGLGLPIAQKVVEIHGGTLEVESAINAGSTFIITLPLTKAKAHVPLSDPNRGGSAA